MGHVVIDYQTVLVTAGIIGMYPQKKSIFVFLYRILRQNSVIHSWGDDYIIPQFPNNTIYFQKQFSSPAFLWQRRHKASRPRDSPGSRG